LRTGTRTLATGYLTSEAAGSKTHLSTPLETNHSVSAVKKVGHDLTLAILNAEEKK
jgi:hypothetical protein